MTVFDIVIMILTTVFIGVPIFVHVLRFYEVTKNLSVQGYLKTFYILAIVISGIYGFCCGAIVWHTNNKGNIIADSFTVQDDSIFGDIINATVKTSVFIVFSFGTSFVSSVFTAFLPITFPIYYLYLRM